MKQSIYDNNGFAKEYDKMKNEKKDINANDLIEVPTFRSLMPDFKDKKILDLGCGDGENDKYFKEHGAKYNK